MSIEADTKDWTWVLQRRCPECGVDSASIARTDIARRVRAIAASWRQVLADDDTGVRPSTSVWSPLEYGCHVRDVLRLYDVRLTMMLAEVDPLFQNWDQDETAVEQRYDLQDPAMVAVELSKAAEVIAAAFDSLSESQWQRTGRRSDGASFTITTFAQYFLHDVEHHLYDVAK